MQKHRHGEKKRSRGLSEGQLAALLVLPALLVIASIAVYPILRTVWYSLFDLRLNHPTRSSTYFSYSLDLEKYADSVYTLRSQLTKASEEAATPEGQRAIANMADLLAEEEAALFCTETRQDTLAQVNALVASYTPVNDDQLRYMSVSSEEIEAFKTFLSLAGEAAQTAL